ncbi:4'-phosphopantetheinyl transferase family protein [Achromobacter pestifer]|uniref:Enterobactin synthase component D n=1 Tax=Achromobacter pestifer TaxID=1353889 RepID=A0A6S6YRC6_9BURK|nr:4'-phosphopantetheinyl transferase superfamily protein [Achromobacter pestifer]CAB3638105.1 hypothetical protein LMG3431_01851 [Achromobacter pestifer]
MRQPVLNQDEAPDPWAPFPVTPRLLQQVRRITPEEMGRDDLPPGKRRQAEFQAGRELAAALLASLGSASTQVGVAKDRSPIWPDGYLGSISHSRRLVGVAIGRKREVRGIGIDIEAIANEREVEAIESVCMRPEERKMDPGALTRAQFTTLLFSSKEAFYKCMHPLTRFEFDFTDVSLTRIDPSRQRLEMQLVRTATPEFRQGHLFHCGYQIGQGHVYTALELGY